MVDHQHAVSGADDTAVSTDIYRRPHARQTLSAQLWSCDIWASFPHQLSEDGTYAVRGEPERVQHFLAQHFTYLAEHTVGFALQPSIQASKRDYIDKLCDVAEIRNAGDTVGVFVGAPEDWGTYYLRMFALAPTFQKRVLARRFFRECLFEPLTRCGVQRVNGDTSPHNRPMTLLLNELQFRVSGNLLTERWGALVRYTKFLDPASESQFQQRFGGARP